MRWAFFCTAIALTASLTQAASRAQFGGTLRLAIAHRIEETDPLLADTPWEATLHSLQSRSICSIVPEGKSISELTAEISHPSATEVRVRLPPGIHGPNGSPLTAQDLAQSWLRVRSPEASSPYRSLLFPVIPSEKQPGILAVGPAELQLSLQFPWPDFESSLCHPALAVADGDGIGIGPFSPSKAAGTLLANPDYPRGLPFADRIVYFSNSERTVARKIALGQVDLALTSTGPGATTAGLFSTYLAFDERKTGRDFRRAFAAAVDSSDLARYFAATPSEPGYGLLPKAIDPEQVSGGVDPRQPHPNPLAPGAGNKLTLIYDMSLDDQRRVAERIQVKLHDLGYRIALQPVARRTLRQRWARKDFDLAILSLLLPPRPAAALAVILDLAGQPDLMRTELQPLGQISNTSARDAKAKERASALAAQVPLLPLYSQGMRVFAKANVEGLKYDAYGLPVLEEVFLRSP